MKALKIALKVLNMLVTVALVLTIAAASALAFSARRSGDAIPTVMGYKVLNVISGSMEPTIHTGDVIVVKPLANAEQEIKDGDIITYRSANNPDMLITHRVVGTILVNGQPVGYGTQGDANESPDVTPVSPSQVVGRYEWRIPYFGYVSAFLRKPAGVITFVIIPGLVLVALEFRKMWLAMTEAEKAKAAAASQQGGEQG